MKMLLWKGRFPSVPSLIILEIDGIPHQDGSPGTCVCHQVIFHPKLCCFPFLVSEGKKQGERRQSRHSPFPMPSAPCGSCAPAVAKAGGAAFSRDEGCRFPPCGKGIQRPNPRSPPETRFSGVSSLGSRAWPAGVPVACLRESRAA